MSRSTEVVEFENCFAETDTAKALLVRINGTPYWVPKSAIHEDSEVYEMNTSGRLIVQQWWAEKEGLV